MKSYDFETVDQTLSEWIEEQDLDIVTKEQLRENYDLPSPGEIYRFYPSLRDAIVSKGVKYQRNEWITEFSLEEEDYPDHIETSTERDIYALHQERNGEIGYTEICQILGSQYSKVVETVGPIDDPGPFNKLD